MRRDGRHGDTSGPALARALDRTVGVRAVPGNRVSHLAGPAAIAAVLRVIESARVTAHVENYIIRDDGLGAAVADRLAAAARRGVRVAVLYDQLGCRRTGRAYWRRLRHAGVAVRAFNPVNPFRPLRSLRRDHCKFVSADGRVAVVGGMCIGDEWVGGGRDGAPPWRDTAVEVTGPAVSLLEQGFARRWERAGPPDPAPAATPVSAAAGTDAVRVVEGEPGRQRLYRAMNLLVASAGHRLWITDAYLVLPSALSAGLLAAARDGVDVRLLLPGRSDVPAVRDLTRVGYRDLLGAGVRIWEWQGPMLHAKTVVVDDTWFKVGSSNLNASSLFANHELDLIVEGGVASEGAHQFLRDLGSAVEIVLRPVRGPDAIAQRLPPAVVPTDRGSGRRPRRTPMRKRAVTTLRQVSGGLLRSALGTTMLALAGAALFALALPRVVAYTFAVVSLALAVVAAGHFVRRRRSRE